MVLESGETRNVELVAAVVTTCLVFAVASFMVRMFFRCHASGRLGWDDYWAMMVMTFCVGMSSCNYIGLSIGFGVHELNIPDDDAVIGLRKGLYGFQLLWEISTFAAKSGFLLTCYSLYPKTWIRGASVATGVLSLCLFLASLSALAFQCTPISNFWLPTPEGFCINHDGLYLSLTILNVLNNVAVLALPLPMVWGLGWSMREKLWVSPLVLLGLLTFISSILQIFSIGKNAVDDSTYTSIPYTLSCIAEVQTIFMLTNLSLVWPLPSVSPASHSPCEAQLESGTDLPTRPPQAPPRCLRRSSASSFRRFATYISSHRSSSEPMMPRRAPVKWQFSTNLRSAARQSSNQAINIQRSVVCEVEDAMNSSEDVLGARDKRFESRVM